jgi:hypothetical protein
MSVCCAPVVSSLACAARGCVRTSIRTSVPQGCIGVGAWHRVVACGRGECEAPGRLRRDVGRGLMRRVHEPSHGPHRLTPRLVGGSSGRTRSGGRGATPWRRFWVLACVRLCCGGRLARSAFFPPQHAQQPSKGPRPPPFPQTRGALCPKHNPPARRTTGRICPHHRPASGRPWTAPPCVMPQPAPGAWCGPRQPGYRRPARSAAHQYLVTPP